MGKRKKSARKPQGPKKKEALATTFNCLFCNHENAVTCKLDKKAGIGQLQCKICGQQFQSNINYLSHAVDVYSEWVDACDEVAKQKSASSRKRERDYRREESPPIQSEPGTQKLSDLDEDDEDELDMRISRHRQTIKDNYENEDDY